MAKQLNLIDMIKECEYEQKNDTKTTPVGEEKKEF